MVGPGVYPGGYIPLAPSPGGLPVAPSPGGVPLTPGFGAPLVPLPPPVPTQTGSTQKFNSLIQNILTKSSVFLSTLGY